MIKVYVWAEAGWDADGFSPVGAEEWHGSHYGQKYIGFVEELRDFAFGKGVLINGEVYPVELED